MTATLTGSWTRVTSVVAVLFGSLLSSGCSGDDLITNSPPPADDQPLPISNIGSADLDVREQFLTNSSFEEGDTLPSGWWVGGSDTEGLEFEWSTGGGTAGSRSVTLSRATSTSGFGFVAQTVAVGNLTGTRLTLTTSIKLDNVAGQGVAIAIRGDDTMEPSGYAETFASTESRVPVNGNVGWGTLDVELDQYPAGIQSITVYLIFLPGTTGAASFDDVVLSSGEPTPSYHLVNTTLEEDDFSERPWWHGGLESQLYAFEWSTEHAASPTHSLKLEKTTGENASFGFWAQTIRADSLVGGGVTLTASIRLRGVQGEGVAIAIRGDDTPLPSGEAEVFATTEKEVQITGSWGWAPYSVTLPDVPPEIQSITVYLIQLPGTRGSVYFDDIDLSPSE